MATRKTTSVKGEIVDFDLLETKQKIEHKINLELWTCRKEKILFIDGGEKVDVLPWITLKIIKIRVQK